MRRTDSALAERVVLHLAGGDHAVELEQPAVRLVWVVVRLYGADRKTVTVARSNGPDAMRTILARLREAREQVGVLPIDLERDLILGPGWIDRFERGESVPDVDLLIALAQSVDTDLAALVAGIEIEAVATIRRALYAEPTEDGVRLHFPYGDFEATYQLKGATIHEFEKVLKTLRDALASEAGTKTEAVTGTFLEAVHLWPHANPSDLWWFLVHRAYLDPFNHPASDARRDLSQSWRRTAGWALERVLVEHYAEALEAHGVRVAIANLDEKQQLLPDLARRLEADKVDVVLTTRIDDVERLFGVVHVKSSFAERRTDDVPLSEALIAAGYTSIFWTMDCKSAPAAVPVNRGELGQLLGEGEDQRSAKRRDFEVSGSFSACFSYNGRTVPTPDKQQVMARVHCLDFSNPDDAFVRFVVSERDRASGSEQR